MSWGELLIVYYPHSMNPLGHYRRVFTHTMSIFSLPPDISCQKKGCDDYEWSNIRNYFFFQSTQVTAPFLVDPELSMEPDAL